MDTITRSLEPKTRSSAADRQAIPASPLQRLRRKWMALFSRARYDRLDGELKVTHAEIERRIAEGAGMRGPIVAGLPGAMPLEPDSSGEPAPEWAVSALAMLAEARDALEAGKLDLGWRLLHAARRMEIFGLDTQTELPAYVAALRAESEKLKAWRQHAVRTLVGTAEGQTGLSAAAAWRAALVRDEHFDNQGYKDHLVRTQMLFLIVILAVTMATILALVRGESLPLGMEPAPAAFFAFLGVTLFGILGGTVSAMLRTSNVAESARIPAITSANRVTFMRILMGGASALLVYVALESQLTGIFSQAVASGLSNLSPQTAYVVAFAAGFSERLVLRAVEHVAGRQQPDRPAADKGNAQAE